METRARIDEDLRFIADTVKIPGRGQFDTNIPLFLEQWLRNAENGRWLLILDNANNGDVFFNADHASKNATNATAAANNKKKSLSFYLPQYSHGSILIISRKKEIAETLTGNHKSIIEVNPINEEHAIKLLRKKTGHQPDMENVANKYLKDFEKSDRHKLNILNRNEGINLKRNREISNSVIITWQILFEAIRSERQLTINLLSLINFFDHQGIPESLVQPRNDYYGHNKDGNEPECNKNDNNRSDYNNDSDSPYISSSSDGLFGQSFEDNLKIFRDYNLVFINDIGNVFKMHNFMQLAIKRWLKIDEKMEIFKAQYINRIAGDFFAGYYNNWPKC
ncbi:hypothetical protein PoMZ_05060 [Pyricularia oryzae]|uniref:NB-ARC domain-containing protein n=1 Tax=Pyricularia oryzae TaxID=318829 RepID=A0A4V1C6G9_PYROR|nr:hypothetical protein PoMZ_04810 [Pyricularia oryzae]QBZ60089.1 hypothetical protein PoMZ_05060 [Pyricularia oryzae]